jgi:dienelactone hydrolase
VWLVGFEYWNQGIDDGTANWAVWLPYIAVAFGISWIAFIRLRWIAYRVRRGPIPGSLGLILFLKPLLLLLFFVLVMMNRINTRQLSSIGSETIVLLAGMALSLAMAVGRESLAAQSNRNVFTLQPIIALIAVLSFAAIFHPDWSRWNQLYAYRDELRWTGPFKNPNQFGLAMALGFVLISAFPILGGLRLRNMALPRSGGFGLETGVCRIKRMRCLLVTLAAILGSTVLLLGLYKSYSRGAWLSGFLGVLYLVMARRRTCATQNGHGQATNVSLLKRPSRRWTCFTMISGHHLSILFIAVSILAVSFWCFRETNIRGIRRVWSVANPYDPSWRNRVDAYVGSLQIMSDHPWRGIGWGQPETVYSEYYMSDRLTEGLAIVLNDYFTLGMSLGLPALCCFAGYILITLNGEQRDVSAVASSNRRITCGALLEQPAERSRFLGITARAGVIVLLTGFWFDRGLLLWSFGILFWFLLEFSTQDFSSSTNPNKSQGRIGDGSKVPVEVQDQPRRGLGKYFHFSFWVLLLIVLAFYCAMVWAKERDPFQRVSFRLNASATKQCHGIVVSPKPAAQYPLAMYLYGAESSLLNSGRQLRLIAKSGFDAASFEYDKESQPAFNEQFATVCHYLRNRSGTQTNIVWVTYGLGARMALNFALSHPDLQPDLLICIEGAWTEEMHETLENMRFRRFGSVPENMQPNLLNQPLSAIKCPVLLVQNPEHSASPQAAYEKLAALLRAAGTSVRLCILPEASSDSSPDSLWGLRMVMQYSAAQFPPPDYTAKLPDSGLSEPQARQYNAALRKAGENRNQIWQAIARTDEAKRPAAMSFIAHLNDFELARISMADLQQCYTPSWLWQRRIVSGLTLLIFASLVLWKYHDKLLRVRLRFRQPGKEQCVLLKLVTCVISITALGVTGLNLLVPELNVNEFSLSMAKSFLLRSHAEDISFLGRHKIADKIKLKMWLQHVQLANLQRHQFYSSLENDLFQQYILSPQIDSQAPAWNSRKELWEYFQPRIRKQHDPLLGAKIIVDYLLERVGIDSSYGADQDVDTIWIQKMAGEGGFQRIYVAALRSVGIAARINGLNQVEIWTRQAWTAAPKPLITSVEAGMFQTNSVEVIDNKVENRMSNRLE